MSKFEQAPSGLHLPAGMSAGAIAQTSDLEAHRERPLLVREAQGPWGGRVAVTRVTKRQANAATMQRVVFEVTAAWFGPPMTGTLFPGDDPDAEGFRSDAWWTDRGELPDCELAKEVAERAAEALRAPQVPNLPEIAAEARRRRA